MEASALYYNSSFSYRQVDVRVNALPAGWPSQLEKAQASGGWEGKYFNFRLQQSRIWIAGEFSPPQPHENDFSSQLCVVGKLADICLNYNKFAATMSICICASVAVLEIPVLLFLRLDGKMLTACGQKELRALKIREIARVENYNPTRAQTIISSCYCCCWLAHYAQNSLLLRLLLAEKRVVKLNGNQRRVEAFVCLTVILLIIFSSCREVCSFVVLITLI